MRYTEAMSPIAAEMMEDIKLDTVDFQPTYDERHRATRFAGEVPEPAGQRRGRHRRGHGHEHSAAQPGRSLRRARRPDRQPGNCDRRADGEPAGPDFPTGGIVCGRYGIRKGYHTGRGKVVLRATCNTEEHRDGRVQLVFSDIPYQQTKESVLKKIAEQIENGRIPGAAGEPLDESDRKTPVRIVVRLKRGEDPNVTLNQLYQYTPLQDSFSVIMLALVDGRPRTLPLKEFLRLFLEHRINVIRRRTQYQLRQARARSHLVEGS